MFKKWELAVFMLTGKIVAIVGGMGAVVTIMFDRIARGMPISLGWLQITGIVSFVALAMFGIYADIFLNDTIKPLIHDYLEG